MVDGGAHTALVSLIMHVVAPAVMAIGEDENMRAGKSHALVASNAPRSTMYFKERRKQLQCEVALRSQPGHHCVKPIFFSTIDEQDGF